jgi:hypothetical protein
VTGDLAIEAVLALVGVTRADLGILTEGRRDALAAHVHEAYVDEDVRSDERGRSGRGDAEFADAASQLLGEVKGLIERGGLPVGEDPRSLELFAVCEVALTMVDRGAGEDEAAGRILTQIGLDPGRIDRLKPAAQKTGLETLRSARWILDRDAQRTTETEAARQRSGAAGRLLAHAYLWVHHRGRPPAP